MTLPLRFGNALERAEKLLRGGFHRHSGETTHKLAFTFPHQPGIDVDAAHAALPEGARTQGERHAGIHAAAHEEEDAAAAHRVADLPLQHRRAAARVPVFPASAHAKYEIRQILPAPLRVDHFGVKLHRVKLLAGRGHRGDGARSGAAGRGKALGQAGYRVAVAHPDLLPAAQPFKQRIGNWVHLQGRHAILAPFAFAHLAAQQMRHKLLAIADAEHRNAAREDRWVHRGAARIVHAAGAAGNHDAARGRQFAGGRLARPDFGVDS